MVRLTHAGLVGKASRQRKSNSMLSLSRKPTTQPAIAGLSGSTSTNGVVAITASHLAAPPRRFFHSH
jgi:hypothetical protein